MIDQLTVEKLADNMRTKGHKVFTGAHSLNLFGVRSNQQVPGKFDDRVGCFWWDEDGQPTLFSSVATTDPGTYYLHNPMNVRGTIVMAPGQFRGVYKVGKFKGYDTLRQIKPIEYYRLKEMSDFKKYFENPDQFTKTEEIAGTHIHRATGKGQSIQNKKWSAGCQVQAFYLDHEYMVKLAKWSSLKYGDSFSYTLMEEQHMSL